MGLNSFPQELIDHILNELHEDISALQSCLLVSRAFVPTSRRHLFSRIRLTPPKNQNSRMPNRCREFYKLVMTSPHIASYVKHLEIIDGQRWERWHNVHSARTQVQGYPWMATSRTLPLLLPLLENLTSVTMGCPGGVVNWRTVTRVVKNSLRAAFALPGITHLGLYNIEAYSDLAEVMSFFSKSSNLKNLSIFNLLASPYVILDPPDVRPRLDSLALSTNGNDPQPMVSCIYSPQSVLDISHVKNLRVCDIGSNSVQHLLDAMHDSLEHLETRGSKPLRLNIAHCHRLRSISASLRSIFDGSIFEAFTSTIRSQDVSNIETITLELSVVEPCDYPEWRALDDVLTRPEMHSLRRVRFMVYLVRPSRFPRGFSEYSDIVKANLTGLCARSLLTIEEISYEDLMALKVGGLGLSN